MRTRYDISDEDITLNLIFSEISRNVQPGRLGFENKVLKELMQIFRLFRQRNQISSMQNGMKENAKNK